MTDNERSARTYADREGNGTYAELTVADLEATYETTTDLEDSFATEEALARGETIA